MMRAFISDADASFVQIKWGFWMSFSSLDFLAYRRISLVTRVLASSPPRRVTARSQSIRAASPPNFSELSVYDSSNLNVNISPCKGGLAMRTVSSIACRMYSATRSLPFCSRVAAWKIAMSVSFQSAPQLTAVLIGMTQLVRKVFQALACPSRSAPLSAAGNLMVRREFKEFSVPRCGSLTEYLHHFRTTASEYRWRVSRCSVVAP